MEITGPFLDRGKKRAQHRSCWYLSYTVPKVGAQRPLDCRLRDVAAPV